MERSERPVMAVIEGVKSNITPGVLSNGWVWPGARVFVSSISSPAMINAAVCETFWIGLHRRDETESPGKQRHRESPIVNSASRVSDGLKGYAYFKLKFKLPNELPHLQE